MDRRRLPSAMAVLLAAAAAAAAVAMSGCGLVARHGVATRAPRDAASPWVPPRGALPPAEAPPAAVKIPPEYLERAAELSLAQIVDLALRNNPQTRASWAAAKAAAGALGSEQGAWWPQLELDANYTKSKNSFSQSFSVKQTTYTPSGALTWVLFDFGQRAGKVEQARQALYQANWSHNATIQDVVLEVEQAYYQYLQSKATRQAGAQAVAEADTNLQAAQDRLEAGLGTIADVLQARSNRAQAQLALQTADGQVQTIRGSLATAMGLSPTVPYDIGTLPDTLPTVAVDQVVEDLIRDARLYRPDLAASRAAVLAARAHARAVGAEGWPSISAQGNLSRRFYNNPDLYSDNYQAGIFLTLPLFTGFSHSYDVLEARAQADQAEQQYQTLRSSVELDVWNGYYGLLTAKERLATARDLLAFATQSHDVALESYRAGVGTILDLLTAQTTLEQARAQDVQARADWLLAVAQLAHATGRLGPATPQPTARPPKNRPPAMQAPAGQPPAPSPATPPKDGGR